MSISPLTPLRIALVCNRYHPSVGGIDTHVARLAAALSSAGHEVAVVTHDLGGDTPDREGAAGASLRRFLPLLPDQPRMASPALGRHLADAGAAYDVVHVHGAPDTPAALATRWWAGALVLSPHHGSGGSHLRTALRVPSPAVGRRILDRADAIVCLSAAERRALLQAFPRGHDRAVVVTEGVDLDRSRPAVAHPTTDDRARVLVAGRLESYQRIDVAVAAAGLLRRDHRLDVCGDGPERPALESQVARSGLDDTVALRGAIAEDDLARSIATAACVVDLSAYDARGTVLLEAAAAGTPIVASATDAHVEAQHRFGDLVTLVPSTAGPRAVAAAVRGAAARPRRPVEVPTWDDVAWSMADVYRRVLARSPHTRWRIPA